MEKTILYPFESFAIRNRRTYALALQMAREIDARLIVFTVVPENFEEDDLNEIYLHLLELDGYYQSNCNYWRGPVGVQVQRVIRIGSLTEQLREWLRRRPTDYLVCQPHSRVLNSEALRHRLSPLPLPELIGEG